MENWLKLAEILNKQLGLTPYESQAYVSLLIHGPMSPSEIARKSRIPRPRAYDVLHGLVEKGLLVEQSGKPPIYAAIEPAQGLKNLLTDLETETLSRLEEKKENVRALTKELSQMHDRSKTLTYEKSKVWFTRRDAAFVSIYAEAIRNCEKEILVASTSLHPPEKEIIDAIKCTLKKGVSVKVVRQITDSWTVEDLKTYEEYINAGSQVRHLDIKEIPLRFMVFDEKDVIIVFPSETQSLTPQTLEALWVRIPALAKILHEHFEDLWRKARPMLPILREMKKKKSRKSSKQDFSQRIFKFP